MGARNSNVLIVHTGAIGDFILTFPALSRLREESRVTLAGNPDRLGLAKIGGLADYVYSLEAIDFQSVFDHPSQTFLDFANGFDRAIVCMSDEGGEIDAAFQKTSVSTVDIFPGLPPVTWTRHASEYYLEQIGLSVERSAEWTIEGVGEPLDVVIHQGSGSPKKNRPLEYYLRLADKLEREGRTVTWLLGPVELEQLDFRPKNALIEPDLSQLARRLVGTKQFIGNDSGMAHLAAALGIPTTVYFVSTDPKVWAPLGEHVEIIQPDD